MDLNTVALDSPAKTQARSEHGDLIVLNPAIDELFIARVGRERYFAYRKAWNEATTQLKHPKEFPVQLDFELNYSCNLRCPMCTWSAEKTSQNKEVFSFDRFKEIIDEGVANGLHSVRLNYINEPLVRKDLSKFIRYCVDNGVVDVMFSTNGALLRTEALCRELIESGLTRIQFSIDAVTDETFQKMRRGTTLERVVSAVHLFLDTRKKMNASFPLVRVNFVKSNANRHEAEPFIDYWREQGVDLIAVQHYMQLDVKTQHGLHVKNFEKPSANPDEKYTTFKCASPFRGMTVRNFGDVLPCCTFYGAELLYGDAKNSLKEIWQSEKMEAMRELHRTGRYHENDTCRRCVESHAPLLDN